MNDVNRIAAGAKLVGDLATENDIRIDGDFEGRLYCNGRLVVGEKATLKGDIFCANVDFSGSMAGGHIYARETLSLKAGCTVQGDLYFQRFQVELEAKFTGACKVLAEGEFAKVSAPVSALLK
jgi:cytoskeletal protein CcmA (bactofilin family)